ncbi:hypothetical protein Hdeb2414_s0028g00703251 [Helianthus debilis subsp. tardiflorus]
MPTSTYPKEWKRRFIFVSVAMMPESLPLRDPKASIEHSVWVFSADEIVQWKRMYENPMRAFTLPEGVLAMGGLSPLYSVRPRAFFGKKGISALGLLCLDDFVGLLQGDCRDVKFMVGDKVDPDMSLGLEKKAPRTGSSVCAGDSIVEEKDEENSSDEAGDSRGSLRGSSKAPIEISPVPASTWARDKTPEISVACVNPAFDISPLQATGTSKPS